MAEVFEQLESNNKEKIEEAKKKILDQFSIIKDPWLLNGLYEYYLSTNSARIIVILVNLKEPHYMYLFDRLSESILKSPKNDHKVQALTLLGHIVRSQPTWLYKLPEHHLLKDLLKLLKCEVEILPLISALLVLIVLIPMIPYSLGDLLNDLFDIFSRLASWNYTPARLVDDELIHMQVALYALFLRLYGMFPCNFLAYLRSQYKDKNRPVFNHTIKPMLESVKMNPSLVTTSKDNETANERWRKMAVHDVIVECERFSLDVSDNFCAHDSCQLASGFRSRSGTTNSTMEQSYYQTIKSFAATIQSSNQNHQSFQPIMVYNPKTPPIEQYVVDQPEFTHDENIILPAGSSPPEAAIEATPETTPILQETDLQKSSIVVSSPKKESPFTFPAENIGRTSLPTSPLKIQISPDSTQSNPIKSFDSSVGNDEEILVVERKCEPVLKQCDSVLHESEDSTSENMDEDRSSPCAVGGLHMPNSKSMKDFTQRVQRLRHHSQCNPELEHDLIITNENDSGMVRRASSCPEMKKSPGSSIKDNVSSKLDETDEECNIDRTESRLSNGIKEDLSDKSFMTSETQTNNFWPMPYEHLFLGIFPSLGTGDVKASPTPVSPLAQDKFGKPSIYEVLDKYIETAIKPNEKDSVKMLKNQLQYVHQQLLFERHRREIHAFKNRRFLAEAKNTQVLEEHNSALRDQVQLQQSDIDSLRIQLKAIHKERQNEKDHLRTVIKSLEKQVINLGKNNKVLMDENHFKMLELDELKRNYACLNMQNQETQTALLDARTEVKLTKKKVLAGEMARNELNFVNKQLVLMGDLQLKYKEKLEELTVSNQTSQELEMLRECYSNETRIMQQHLQEKLIKLEACTSRLEHLEDTLQKKEQTIISLKRLVSSTVEENNEKIKAVEHKYKTQMTICRTLEEKILELYQKIELITGKSIVSPEISSCQEVRVSDKPVSGTSSLSSSLTSSPSSNVAFKLKSDDSPSTSKTFDEKSTN